MGVEYVSVQWNRQKKFYDAVLIGGVAAYLAIFGVLTKILFPRVTDEIMLIRAFGTAAFLLLHIILCIGPLCRLNPIFLPLLYNRRHAGVTCFLLGLIHAALVVITYHAGSDTNPILSIFVSSPLTGSVAGVPFQPFGFFALIILFLMAATSHDFWLANLSAPVWKSLHMLVYVAQTTPYPHLLVPRPGNADGLSRYSTYYLVAPWKFGLDRDAIAPLDGKSVTLKGTLIYRGDQTMIETKPEWIQAKENSSAPAAVPQAMALGKQTLVGEIVDSKCFLGVMNPGQLTPHRACAIRCISGGVPPVLLARQKDGPAIYLLLVSAEGKPVNKQVLEMVAEPVEITGEVERQGELLILRADPATYRKL